MYCCNCGCRNARDAHRCTNCGSYELREKEVKERSLIGALLGFFLGLIGVGLAGLVLFPESTFERKSCVKAAFRAWGIQILLILIFSFIPGCNTGILLLFANLFGV